MVRAEQGIAPRSRVLPARRLVMAVRRHRPACHDLAAFGVAGRVHVKAEMQDFNSRVAELRKREPARLSVRVDSAVNVLRVLALFAVGDVYASLCKKSAHAPFSARRRS